MKTARVTAFLAVFAFVHAARALIPYDTGTDTDNTYNTTPPLNGAPWNYVAEVTNADVSTDASAVYLGNGFLITANHVNLGTSVLLDGTSYTIDASYTPEQVGDADLKLFKILGNPGLTTLPLTVSATGTADLNNSTTTMVGWGVGKGSAITSSGSNVGWNWGNDSTRAQRWGTNTTLPSYGTDVNNIVYLQTAFNPALGPNTYSASLGDSGSALFQEYSGTWELAGVYVGVDTPGASYYADSPNNMSGMDDSYAIEIEPYSAQITASIPEPRTYALLALGSAGLAFHARCRNRKLPKQRIR